MPFALALILAAAPALTIKEARPGLSAKAKITAEAAIATAKAKIPKGTIVSAELEEEKGALIYSFDIKTAGVSGIDEVAVDAITGKVIAVEHETPADEAKEKKADQHP